MTSDTLFLLGLAGLVVLLAESGILYAAVGMAGGEYIEERNSFLTAVFVTLLMGLLGAGLRYLLLEHEISQSTALLIIVPTWFLTVMFCYRLELLRAFMVLLVQVVLGVMIVFVLSFWTDLFGLFLGLGRIFPAQ